MDASFVRLDKHAYNYICTRGTRINIGGESETWHFHRVMHMSPSRPQRHASLLVVSVRQMCVHMPRLVD